MIARIVNAPLSPPTSPRMSDIHGKDEDLRWDQTPDVIPLASDPALSSIPEGMTSGTNGSTTHIGKSAAARPTLRSIKSFPYSLGPSSRLQTDNIYNSVDGPAGDFKEHVVSQGPQPTASADLAQPTYGGSAPTSPVERLTPRSQSAAAAGQEGAAMEDDDMDLETLGPDEDTEKPPMTAAELRAHKRKMKRFRLTHNQTRFLLSEFARQPHPDAAHRERLSREIPGLSARQVQVWFQNRRAKLKRLTTDDRERMMRSRALPADFDMTQALRAPFGAPTPSSGTPDASPGGLGSFSNPSGVRPLTLDTLRRVPEYDSYHYASPTGVTPSMGNFGFTPPQSATDAISPSSALSISPFAFPPQDSPRRPGYGLSLNTQVGYGGSTSQLARQHLQDRFGRPMGEIAGSPLRTSMSYSGLSAGDTSQPPMHTQVRSASMSDHGHYTHERGMNGRASSYANIQSAGPYGLGFTNLGMTTYPATEQITQTAGVNTHIPAEIPSYHRKNSTHLQGSPITYGGYNTSAYTTPQMPQYTQYTSQYTPQAFQAPFPNNAQEQMDRNAHIQNALAQTMPQSSSSMLSHSNHLYPTSITGYAPVIEEDDDSDGGVPIGTSY